MKKLIGLLKEIELEYRSFKEIKSKSLWTKLSELNDWEYRIVQDFILRLDLYMKNNNLNFLYKLYQEQSNFQSYEIEKKCDLLIVTTRRNEHDLVLTDVANRLVIPENLKYLTLDIWGLNIVEARNLGVKKACEFGSNYLLFIDDDIIVPNNALLKLYNLMIETNKLVVAANYYKKVEPLVSAHGKFFDFDKNESIKEVECCAMGFTLINIQEVSKVVPFPLFWVFVSQDGFWNIGEDYFFSKNLFEYTNQKPLVDLSIKTLHYDKVWKRCYGEKDNNVIYASNAIESAKQFESLRVPTDFPLILIGTPVKNETDPIAYDLTKLKMRRSFRSQYFKVIGYDVDEARTALADEALKRDAKYLLFIDNDIIPADHDFCTLIDIMESDERIGIVSGNYQLKGLPSDSVHLHLNDKGKVVELDKIKNDSSTIKNNWLTALGFSLVRCDCFRQIRKPWFKCYSRNNLNQLVNEDAHFTELILQNGYESIITQDVQCLHVDFQTKKIYGKYNKNYTYADNNILKSGFFEIVNWDGSKTSQL